MSGNPGRPKSAASKLLRLLFLATVASLGAALSPLGDAGRRMREWADRERARLT